ncbi:hypothetical protein [Acinetobacter variabilis]|uniref:Uncharacterized protein n=1 Tax=Acinetobacter variabilis TaxID=70346 RepID=A0A7T8ASB4_9GAMM|nr:hypothetical protein [Acinetobacter variabilis]MBO3661687.1 hypothetical protein [Acinetobacter variabilis]QQN89844.1 hypothetical protein IAQ69_16690 [Acinetobacter variabilis]WKT74830.1 hypothetical protein Q3F87_16230 [Acinetobacter variabilis]
MSAINLIDDDDNEAEIATLAGRALRAKGIEVAQRETVMYVVNDTVVSKAPNSAPVVIKHLSGRNPKLAKLVASRGTFKIKKRKFNDD